MASDPLLTLPEAVKYTASSESTLRRHYTKPEADPHHLDAIKHFGHVKFRQSALDDWINRTAGDAA